MTRVQPWTEADLMQREDVFEALVSKAVKATFRTIAKELRTEAITASVSTPPPPPETAPPVSFQALESAVMATWTTAVEEALFPYLTDTFLTSAERVVAGVEKATGVAVDTLTNTYAQEFLSYARNRMVATGNELWARLRTELSEGFQAGESIPDIARRLQDVAALSLPRALTVARTEVISAANAGSYLQMIDAGFGADEVTKVWLATEDARTRESHRHADNQGVQLTDEFSIDIYKSGVKTGSEGLEFPGDPVATPGNVINCRCSLAFDFSEDDEGALVAAKNWIETQHPRDKDGKFKEKGAPDKFVPDEADSGYTANAKGKAKSITALFTKYSSKPTAAKAADIVQNLEQKAWDLLDDDLKAELSKKALGNAAKKEATQKKLDALKAGAVPPTKNASKAEKASWLVDHKLSDLTGPQIVQLLNNIDQDTWDSLTLPQQIKVANRVDVMSHPEDKFAAQKRLTALAEGNGSPNVKKAVEQLVQEAADKTSDMPAKAAGNRPVGGKTKAGKAWEPGQSVALKVQFLYNTEFEDGAIMAVRPESDERLVLNGKKIERQKLGADGKYATTESLTRGALMAKYQNEDGWKIPTAGDLAKKEDAPADAPSASLPAPGKPVALKVQLLFNAKYAAGDVVAEKVDSNERIVWNGKKMERQKWNGSDWETTETLTRGALMAKYKDESGWTSPTGAVGGTPDKGEAENVAPEAPEGVSPAPAPAYVTKTVAGGDAGVQEMQAALNDPAVLENTVLFQSEAGGYTIIKDDDGVATGYYTPKGGEVGPGVKMYSEDFSDLAAFGSKLVEAMDAADKANKPAPAVSTALGTKKAHKPIVKPGIFVSEDDVEDVKAEFDSAYEGDVLYENDDLSIVKVNDSLVQLESKKSGAKSSFPLENLSTEKADEFSDENDSPAPARLNSDPDVSAIIIAYQDALFSSTYKVLGITGGVQFTKTGGGNVNVLDDKTGATGTLSSTQINSANLKKAAAAVKAGKTWGLGQPIPDATASAPVTVTGKTITTSGSKTGGKPLKLSYSVLVNPKTTGAYMDGQVIAENPGEGERLVWNGKTKKFNVQTKDADGKWQLQFIYTKQGAYKNLKDDTGWVTPTEQFDLNAGPAVSGNPVSTVVTPSAAPASPGLKFTTVELNAASDAKVSALSTTQVADIYASFRKKPGAYGNVMLSSPGEDVLEAVLRAQQDFQKKNPGQTLNMLETIKAVDIKAALDAGAPNGGLYEKKLLAWLQTPEGKKSAPKVLHEFRLSPAEKAKILADKKAAEKAELDAKLKKLHDVTAGLSKPSTTDTDFQVQTTASAAAAQADMVADNPWTAAQKAALKKYTGSYYYTVNNALRGLGTLNDSIITDAVNIQKGMRPLAHSMLLFRGTNPVEGMLPSNIDDYKSLIGTSFTEPGFSSTSITNPFGGKIKLEIEAPAGTPAAYVKAISNYSSENEVLLAAGTKFEILSAKQVGYQIVVRVRVVS